MFIFIIKDNLTRANAEAELSRDNVMSKRTIHNFSAGPSCVDAGVLAKLGAELADFEGSGMVRSLLTFFSIPSIPPKKSFL